MSKYIIDVGDAYVRHALGRKLIIPVIINNDTEYWVNTNIQLTPYTEPDTEKVREEAYAQGYSKGFTNAKVQCNLQAEKDMREVGERHYQKGLSDAWEAARKIANMPYGEEEKVFGSGGWAFIEKHTASEAIEKIRRYEQEKEKSEEQKKQESITAEDVMRQYLDTFCTNETGCSVCPLHTPEFTCGRGYSFLTIDQVSDEEVRRAYFTVLAKMKEEQP